MSRPQISAFARVLRLGFAGRPTYLRFKDRLRPVRGSGCDLANMSRSIKKLGIDRLNILQRLALIEEIWDSIDADESAAVRLSDAQRAELCARLDEDDDEDADDILSWEDMDKSLPLRRGGR